MKLFAEFALTILLSLVAAFAIYALVLRFTRRDAKVRTFHLRQETADKILLFLFSIYVLVFAALSILRHETLHSNFDLAVQDQAIWNSLSGRLLESSITADTPTILGHHFSPLLLALVPVYAVWADVRALLIAQTVILAAAVIPIYWYARAQLGNCLALAISASFFLSPALQYVNLYDFHEIALAMPLLSFATLFLLRRHYVPFLVSISLALLAKEEIAIVIVGFGIFLFAYHRARVLGLLLAVSGAAAFFLLALYVIPHFYGGGYFFANRYESLGNTVPEIIQTTLTRPDKVLTVLSMPGKPEFVSYLMVPLALLPLFGFEVAFLSLPSFGYLLLSNTDFQWSIKSQYSAVLIPFLYFAAIIGLGRLSTWRAQNIDAPPRQFALATLILVAGVVSYYLYAPGPLSRNFPKDPSPIAEQPDESAFTMDTRALTGQALIARVPHDAIVMTTLDSIAQFSDRRYIYEFPTIPDYRQIEYLFAQKDRFWYKLKEGIWANWLATGYFETLYETDSFLLARRREPDRKLQIKYGDHLTLIGFTMVPRETLRGGMALGPVAEWRADQTMAQKYKMSVQVVDAQEHVWAQQDEEPQDGNLPTTQWQIGRTIGDQYSLALPPTMPAGDYTITIGVDEAATANYLDATDATGKPIGTEPVVATVRIEKDKSSYTASELVKIQPMTADFVDMGEMRFLGYAPPSPSAIAGAPYSVGIYWRARQKPRDDYVVVVQLRDQLGHVAFEQSSLPANGTYPTKEWDAGEVLLDWHDFNLPKDLATGEYQIFVSLVDSGSARLLGETQLTTIQVSE